MKCPACASTMQQLETHSAVIEVCTSGWGGLWFDAGELEKFDDGTEGISETILRSLPNSNQLIDRAKQRYCPKCSSQPLNRNFQDDSYHLEIDECSNCSGVWLDLGELQAVRNLNDLKTGAAKIMSAHREKSTNEKTGEISKRAAAGFRLWF